MPNSLLRDYILDHPKFSTGLAMLGLAVAFSQRASQPAVWFCLLATAGIFCTLLSGLAERKNWRQWQLYGCDILIILAMIFGGLWLTHTPEARLEIYYQGAKLDGQ